MITSKAQHILNLAAKNRYFDEILSHNYRCKKFPRDLTNKITFKAQHIVKTAARNNMVTFKAKHIVTLQPKKRIFWRNFNPQLQLQIIPKRPEQYDHLQGSTYSKSCSQKTDILAEF